MKTALLFNYRNGLTHFSPQSYSFMPVCGIEILYPLTSFDSYRNAVPFLDWETPVDTNGGEYRFNAARQDKQGRYYYRTIKHRATFKGLALQVNEVQRSKSKRFTRIDKTEYLLYISGSLHVSHYGYNHNTFTFADLQAEIQELETALQLDPEKAKINNLEAGVNLRLSLGLPPVILGSLLVCANETFTPYPNRKIGYYYSFTEHTLKVYDKALESKVPGSILRIEVHFDRMRKVKGLGITTLADLKDRAKVNRLLELLQEAWQHVLLFDRELLHNTAIKPKDRAFLNLCQYGEYWQREHERGISRPALKKKRDRLTALIRQHGRDYKTEIAADVAREWQKLFEEKRLTKSPGAKPNRKRQPVNAIPVKMKGETVNPSLRACLTCGRDITAQKEGSRFCSEKLYGKEAKKCRNQHSNPQNNFRRKIKTIESKGLLFDISELIPPPGGSWVLPKTCECGCAQPRKNDSDRIFFKLTTYPCG